MFHPSAPITVVGLLVFLASIILVGLIANHSTSGWSCLAASLLGAVALAALVASIPDVIVPIRDPASGGELIVRGHLLDRWLMPEMALSDREELFFPRVPVLHDQPRAAKPEEGSGGKAGKPPAATKP